MDISSILDMHMQSSDPGKIADALINYLDANWSMCTSTQRDELISEAEMFHAAAVEQFFE